MFLQLNRMTVTSNVASPFTDLLKMSDASPHSHQREKEEEKTGLRISEPVLKGEVANGALHRHLDPF